MEVIIAIASALISWFITRYYYKKSLDDQKEVWTGIEEKLLSKIKSQVGSDDDFIKNELRLKIALDDYKKKGTPKYIIDTFNDLNNEQKAILYDEVLMRARGRPSKNNPYK